MVVLRPIVRILPGILLLFMLGACAVMPGQSTPPRVDLVGLQVVSLDMFEQRYRVRLRIQNPNDIDLPVNGLDFSIDLNGRRFASGVSGEAIVVPRYGEAVLNVNVSSNVFRVFEQLRAIGSGKAERFSYRISGNISVANRFFKLPFEREGEVDLRMDANGHK